MGAESFSVEIEAGKRLAKERIAFRIQIGIVDLAASCAFQFFLIQKFFFCKQIEIDEIRISRRRGDTGPPRLS